MTLDYAPPPLKPSLKPALRTIIFFTSWLIYAFLCSPAITQRGFPPLPAHLQGFVLIWIVAVPLTGLLEPFSRRRAIALVIYAFATGFIDCASWPMMVPNHFEPFLAMIMTIIIYGPIHLLVTAILEIGFRLSASFLPSLGVAPRRSIFLRTLVAISLLVGAGFLPSAYTAYDAWSQNRNGVTLAQNEWEDHTAAILTQDIPQIEVGEIHVQLRVDPATGFTLRHCYMNKSHIAHNQKLAEFLRIHGKPPWAPPPVPSPAQIAALLTADNLPEVTRFPYDITPNITVFRTGSIAKWGSVSSSSGSGLSIATAHGLIGHGGPNLPAYVAQPPEFPGLVFVRHGNEWLGIFDANGDLLAEADR